MKTWKFVGINFDHMHMGDLLRKVHEHPHAEIAGICDEQPQRMQAAVEAFGIDRSMVFTDYRQCLEVTRPDIAILCPATAEHAKWTEWVAPFDVDILVEKPFAMDLADADRMIHALAQTGRQLIINWPLRWVPAHITAKRLISEGMIGQLEEVHFYDGNRGPLWHGADKIEREPAAEAKARSWWYHRESGGGSLLDYLGYGTTLGTWFHDGAAPTEVTAVGHGAPGLEVDEHSVTVARYGSGLSIFQTRWGTFTDPWTHQPQPKCGFVLKGSAGTISSYDYEPTIRVQARVHPEGAELPVDSLPKEESDPISHILDRLERGLPIEGPLSPVLCRVGQRIIDSARLSIREKRTVTILP